jgi:RND family efflux transporter MFP subunit
VTHRPSAIPRRPSSIRHFSSVISHLSFPIRHLPFVSCYLLLLILFLASCNPPGADVVPTFLPPPAYGPLPGATYTVARGGVVEMIESRGRVMAKREAPLIFPVGGTLKAVHASPGDTVEEGMLLAELEAPGSQEDALQAQLNLLVAEAQLKTAELQMEALEQEMIELMAKPVMPPVDVDLLAAKIALERAKVELRYAQVEFAKLPDRTWEGLDITEAVSWTLRLNEWNYELAEIKLKQIQRDRTFAWQDRLRAQEELSRTMAIQQLQVEIARVGVDRARLQSAHATEQLSGTLLTAPLSGVVVAIEKGPGDQVSSYDSIGTIADPSELWVVATVVEEDIDRITVGQPVAILLDVHPTEVYSGTVLQVVSQATVWQDRTAYGVTIVFDEDQDVPAIVHMGADVRIAGRSRDDVLLVPTNAILTIGGRTYVETAAEDGDVERIEVQTGITDGVNTEILSGLQEGQVIRMP